jgi:threonine dehydrogenase-like Zn-dependent dehydrogenase
MFETWVEAERMLAQGEISVAPVATHCFPMERVGDAMASITSGEACKVQLVPAG